MDDLATIQGVACEPIRVPRQDAIRLTAFNSLEHLVEHGTTRGFGATGLFQRIDNVNSFAFRIAFQLESL